MVLIACERALTDQINLNKKKNELILNLEELNKVQKEIIRANEADLNQWYRNPITVAGITFTTTVVLGIYLFAEHK